MNAEAVAQLVTANHVLANEGIISGFGHVSVRDPDDDEALYISRARSPAIVEADDILRMDFDGNVLSDDDVRPYKETVIHRAIYRKRDDVNAVVHHHAPSVMPFTITDVELKPTFHMAAQFADGVPTFDEYDPDFGILVATEAEGERMAENLGDHRAQLLWGHGANVVGHQLIGAVISTIFFAMNATYQYQAEQLGSPTYYTGPPESVKQAVDDVMDAPLVQERMWEYLVRRLPDA